VRLVDRGIARLHEYLRGDGPLYGLDPEAIATCARERVRPPSGR
jgi:hypothetical protein